MKTKDLQIVILGASGNLVSHKLIPALFNLDIEGRLDANVRITCVARSDFESDDHFREVLLSFLPAELAKFKAEWKKFAKRMTYFKVSVDSADEVRQLDEAIKKSLPANSSDSRLYYMALSPRITRVAVNVFGEQGLFNQSPAKGQLRRVVFEKPFGRDLVSARELGELSGKYLDESQVYRIDHYLGKDIVQNLLVFRFANTVFEPLWNRNYIDHIQISVLESLGLHNRASYYDNNGVLRDMFQNHLLQLFSLVAMEPPISPSADALRDEKSKALASVRIYDPAVAAEHSVRGQYEGYRDEKDVPPHSSTATFGAIRLFVDNWRWQGVPFYLRSGKNLTAKTTNVIVRFRRPPHAVFGQSLAAEMTPNELTISIQPDEGVSLMVENKTPSMKMGIQTQMLSFKFPVRGIANAYERLLLDVIQGDQSLFIREDEIERAWQIIDPFVEAWQASLKSQLYEYPVGSWGPQAADELIGETRVWRPGAFDKGESAPNGK